MRSFLVFFFFLLTSNVYSQNLISAFEDESIKIEYLATEVKQKKVLLPEIQLVITNKTDQYLLLDFKLFLNYEMTFAEATQVEDLCVGPQKIKKGRIRGLFYQPETLTLPQLTSEDFDLEVEEINLVKVAKCK